MDDRILYIEHLGWFTPFWCD